MRKLQPANPLRAWLAGFARAITPTRQEQAMVAVLLVSLLTGSIVTHCRREYRLHHPAAASPSPRPASQSPAGD
jgi:hypothetical protein